jgi:hypothetical protein
MLEVILLKLKHCRHKGVDKPFKYLAGRFFRWSGGSTSRLKGTSSVGIMALYSRTGTFVRHTITEVTKSSPTASVLLITAGAANELLDSPLIGFRE